MPDYVVYVYTADMFVQGLPDEVAGGTSATAMSANKPLVLTLRPDAKPIAITIRDGDTGTVNVQSQNWNTSDLKFDEVSLAQHIIGGDYNPGSSINAAYTLTGATAWNGQPLSLVTYRLGGQGPDVGPVSGVLSSQGLVPGQSYSFTKTYTTQTAPDPYPSYFDPTDPSPPCFTSGTLILTDHGPVPIEELVPGDRVLTMDNGFQPLLWITSRRVTADALHQRRDFRPVRIAAGALGVNLPEQDLVVSPQHRVLIRSRLTERMFTDREMLVAAKHLVGLPGITIDDDLAPVTYWHMLLARHEVVFSNGAPTETLFTGAEALRGIAPEARAELLALFPDCIATAEGARGFAPGRRARSFARRSGERGQALLE